MVYISSCKLLSKYSSYKTNFTQTFSGSSVGFCINEDNLSVTNLSSENNSPTFRLNAPVVIRAKVKRSEQTLLFIAMHYWGYTSLEVKGWGRLLLPLYLLITVIQQPGTSSPPFRLKCSSEGVIWMCRASFTNSSYPLPWSNTVVSSQSIGWWFFHTYSTTPSPSHRRLGVPSVSSPVSLIPATTHEVVICDEFSFPWCTTREWLFTMNLVSHGALHVSGYLQWI